MEQGAVAAEAHKGDGEAKRVWCAAFGPELARRAEDALAIRVKDAVVPPAPALGELGEIGDDVEG